MIRSGQIAVKLPEKGQLYARDLSRFYNSFKSTKFYMSTNLEIFMFILNVLKTLLCMVISIGLDCDSVTPIETFSESFW